MEIGQYIHTNRPILERWDVEDPNILEVSYDSLLSGDRQQVYERIFAHLGFDTAQARMGCDLMVLFEIENRKFAKKKRRCRRISHAEWKIKAVGIRTGNSAQRVHREGAWAHS